MLVIQNDIDILSELPKRNLKNTKNACVICLRIFEQFVKQIKKKPQQASELRRKKPQLLAFNKLEIEKKRN